MVASLLLNTRWLRHGALVLVCAGIFLAGPASALGIRQGNQPQPQSQGFAISEDVDVVLLPVTVTNGRGQFVSGLEASNFQVYEDGQLQKISSFRSEDVPVTVGLVVDHSGSMAAWRDQVIAGARAFVQDSNSQDKEFVVNFGSGVKLALPPNVPFTGNVDELQAALSLPYASGDTALYDALASALQHVQEDKLNKKVLLLISDGGDDASTHTFKQVLKMAQSANVIIYSIGLLDEQNADQNPAVLRKFAAATGGRSYFPASAAEVVADCRRIAGDIRHQYTLGYSPTNTSNAGYRKIRVRVTAHGRGKLIVRTRGGYFLPPATAGHTD